MTKDEALIKIATVNAMDYEYQAWAREALANDTSQERVAKTSENVHEAVAWANLNALSEQINSVNCGTVYRLPSEAEGRQPLYTTPPQRTWVGLTEAQCGVLWKTNMTPFEYYQAIEAKLKEKNT